MATTYDYAELWTYEDLVARVLDTFGLQRSEGRNLRQAKGAVLDAYREFPNLDYWQWYVRTHRFETDAHQTTGTIAYTHSTRTVTLTGATWPSNATQGLLVYGDIHYPIVTRTDDNNVVLHSEHNPGADVAAGATYRWERLDYPLPNDFRHSADLLELNQTRDPRSIRYVPENELELYVRNVWFRLLGSTTLIPTYTEPEWYTIRRNQEYAAGWSISFARVPATSTDYILKYKAGARNLKYERHGMPACTITVATTTLTGSGFVDGHVGSIVRLSSDGEFPTGAEGDNPYVFQAAIASVANATTAELDTAADATYTNVAGTVSDPIDVDHDAMRTALIAWAEAKFAGRQRRDLYPQFRREAILALKQCKEYNQDQRVMRGKMIYGAG